MGGSSLRCLFLRYAHSPSYGSELDRHTRLSLYLALFLLFLLLCLGSMAQESDAGPRKLLHGVILNSQGQPASDAAVEIWDIRGTRIAGAITDHTGTFRIVGVARPGEYIFVVADAFQIKAERVRLVEPDFALTFTLPEVDFVGGNSSSRYLVSTKQLRTLPKARAHVATAQRAFRRMNFGEAKREVDAAVRADAAFAPSFAMRAFIELAQKDARHAVQDARLAVSLDASDPESFIALAMSCNSLGEFDEAEQAVLEALSLRPDSWQARLELAKSFYGQGNFVVALRELDLGRIDFPDAHLVRGNVMIRLGRNREAQDEFDAFLREGPYDPRVEEVRQIVAKLHEREAMIGGR